MDTINITVTFGHHLVLKKLVLSAAAALQLFCLPSGRRKRTCLGFLGPVNSPSVSGSNTEVTLRDVNQAGKHYPKLPSMLFLKQSQGPGGIVSSDIPITENAASVERNIATELN